MVARTATRKRFCHSVITGNVAGKRAVDAVQECVRREAPVGLHVNIATSKSPAGRTVPKKEEADAGGLAREKGGCFGHYITRVE